MEEYRVRVRIFAVIILCVVVILGLRLAQLQLLETEEYTGESRSNAVRELRVQPARGAVFDRNGVLMVDNAQTYTVMLTPRYFDEAKVGLLARLLEVPDSVIYAKLAEARRRSPFQPARSFREVPVDIFSRVLEKAYQLPGVTYEVDQRRRYVTDAKASHAFGYIREISERELAARRKYGYQQGDIIGKTGLEKRYEPYLRGQLGSEFRLVNIHGRYIGPFQEGQQDRQPSSGYHLHSTIDYRVQALAESLFVGNRGAAVALDPKTGGIIALVSKPDYDPDIFSESVDPETWNWLMDSPEKPMLNRATMNYMPPGSTWKPFMSLMSLASGNIEPGERVVCRGGHPIGGGRRFTCMGVHGALDVVSAIQHSCNTFFFEMMYRSNPEEFSRYAQEFGFGAPAPLELDEQTVPPLPDSAYFVKKIKASTGREVWPAPPGWTLSMGIGQGDIVVTPLQLARYVAAVANKGTLVTPHFVDYLRHPETGEIIRPAIPAPEEVSIQEEYFDLVRQGMRQVMELGTGRLAQIPGIPSGGKTGTAQAPGVDREDHSLFVMFAPWDDPQIVLAVQVENAGYGASAAAPIASLMAEMYLKGELPDSREVAFRLQRAMNARSQPLPQPRNEGI